MALSLCSTGQSLELHTWKFFCDHPACPQRGFTERLPATTRPSARQTERLREALTQLGVATGGAAGARLAVLLLGLRVSATTLLRRLRGAPDPATEAHASPPHVVGIDDWAWKRGRTYGAIVIDLERHRVLDVLPDRSVTTAAAWLAAHSTIEIGSRDRAGDFAEAARPGAPQVVPVAGRFHLLCNLTTAVERILGRHSHALRAAAHALAPASTEAGQPPPPTDRPLTTEQARSAASRARRLTRDEEVLALRRQGATIQAIERAPGLGHSTIHRWLHAGGFPEHAKHRRTADPVVGYLQQRWAEGCRNATQLWRELRAEGVRGTRRMISSARSICRICRWPRRSSSPRAPGRPRPAGPRGGSGSATRRRVR